MSVRRDRGTRQRSQASLAAPSTASVLMPVMHRCVNGHSRSMQGRHHTSAASDMRPVQSAASQLHSLDRTRPPRRSPGGRNHGARIVRHERAAMHQDGGEHREVGRADQIQRPQTGVTFRAPAPGSSIAPANQTLNAVACRCDRCEPGGRPAFRAKRSPGATATSRV